jgi:hypothetical protein
MYPEVSAQNNTSEGVVGEGSAKNLAYLGHSAFYYRPVNLTDSGRLFVG